MYTFFFAERVKQLGEKLAARFWLFLKLSVRAIEESVDYVNSGLRNLQKLSEWSQNGALKNQLTGLFYGRRGCSLNQDESNLCWNFRTNYGGQERNRVGIKLSYRPTRLRRLRNLFLGIDCCAALSERTWLLISSMRRATSRDYGAPSVCVCKYRILDNFKNLSDDL